MAAQPRPSRGWSDCGAVFFLIGVIWVLLFGYSRRDSPVGWRRLRPSGYFVAVVAQPDDIRQELQRSHCSRKLWMRVFRPLPTRRRWQHRTRRERIGAFLWGFVLSHTFGFRWCARASCSAETPARPSWRNCTGRAQRCRGSPDGYAASPQSRFRPLRLRCMSP